MLKFLRVKSIIIKNICRVMCNVFIYNTYFLFHIIQINLARLYTQQQNVTNCFFSRLYYIIELVKEKKNK